MSCDIDSDSFHGTKKFGRRKTVSKRRAYVNTPSSIIKRLKVIATNCNLNGKLQITNLISDLKEFS